MVLNYSRGVQGELTALSVTHIIITLFSNMQKIINIVIVLALLLSGFSLYKVYMFTDGASLGIATTKAVLQLETLQGQQGAALVQVVCRAHMYDLVLKPEETCKKTIEAEQAQRVSATPQPAPATTTAP